MRNCSRAEPPPILTGINESLDHLSAHKVSIELVQLIQPEVVAVKIRVRRIVRVPAQVTEVLHQDERAIEFLLDQ